MINIQNKLFIIIISILVNFHVTSDNAANGAELLKNIHTLRVDGYLNAVTWNSDGSRLASLSDFGSKISIFNTTEWNKVNVINRYGGAYSFNSLAFIQNGDLITSTPIGDYSKDARFLNTQLVDSRYPRLDIFSLIQWDIETAKTVRYLPDVGYPPSSLPSYSGVSNTFTVSKDKAIIAAINKNGIIIFDTRTGGLYKFIENQKINYIIDSSVSVAFSDNAEFLAVGSISGKIYLYDLTSSKVIKVIEAYNHEYSCYSVSFILNDKFVACGRYRVSDGWRNADGIWVRATDSNIAIDLWDASTGALKSSITGSVINESGNEKAANIRAISWNSERMLLAAASDVSVRVWHIDQNSNNLILDQKIPHGAFSVAFSPKGKLAMTSSDHILIFQ
jgi:WD40 repeat protein